MPRARVPDIARAPPYAAIPSPNTIHASLPIPDGQKTSDGRKNRSSAYEVRRPSGTAT